MLIENTRAFCNTCNILHDADILEERGKIKGILHCPGEKQEYALSSNSAMFIEMRKKSCLELDSTPPPDLRYFLNFLSITNTCNFNCKVCGANIAGDKKKVFLTLEEIKKRAEDASLKGTKILNLFGGEPTMHPDLLKIVESLKPFNFSLGIVSNGYLLGKDPKLSLSLKKAGLKRVCLQFDSLEKETLEELGREYLDEKFKAIENIREAGLDLGLNCTVTEYNIEEIPELLEFGLNMIPDVINITFAAAAPIGKYTIKESVPVDKESIIQHLLEAGEKFHFGLKDIFPLPSFRPWGAQLHPDCGAHIPFVKIAGSIKPLNHYFDMSKLYRLMYKCKAGRGFWGSKIIPAIFLIKSLRYRYFFDICKFLLLYSLGNKDYAYVNVGISNYRSAAFQDEKKISRCASCFLTSAGPVKGCIHFFRDEKTIGSRCWEIANGKF